PSLIVENVPEHLTRTKLLASDKVPCLICGLEQKLNKMRNHVARHILLSLRGRLVLMIRPVGSDEPCGFCGLDGCFTQLLNNQPRKPVSISSSCCYHYSRMNYKMAKIPSKGCPSTNVPIHCQLCPPNRVSG
ncbi:hypothetical protein B0H13DRAFT_1466652, partial [Mycena leptocephala]